MGLLVGFSLALLLNTNIKGSGIFRTIYYFPSIIPGVAKGLIGAFYSTKTEEPLIN